MDASGPSAAQYRWSEGKPPSAPTTHIERTCIRGIQSWQWCSAEVGSTGLLGSPAHSSLSVCTVCCPTTKRTTTKRKPAQSLAEFLHLLKYLMSRISFSSPFSKRAEGETSSFRPCMRKPHGAGAVKWRRPRTALGIPPTNSHTSNPDQTQSNSNSHQTSPTHIHFLYQKCTLV